MMSISIIFLFSFLGLVLLAIGIIGKSPPVILVGGMVIALTGIMTYIDGVQEYDGSKNTTLTYNDAANTSIKTMNNVANYTVKKDLFTSGISLIYLLAGAFAGWYGYDYATRKVEAPVNRDRDIEQ